MTTIDNLDKAFESRVRLGIMSVLTGAGQSDFNTLKSMLGVSDGNLASHIKALEELGYIETIKQFMAASLIPLILSLMPVGRLSVLILKLSLPFWESGMIDYGKQHGRFRAQQ